MHILVSCKIRQERTNIKQEDLAKYDVVYSCPHFNAFASIMSSSAIDPNPPTYDILAMIPYKITLNTSEIKLVSTPNEEGKTTWTMLIELCDKQSTVCTLTQEEYDRITEILAKINQEEAALLNELALEKACKKGVKELEDVEGLWDKKQVNALLGLEV